MRNTIPRLGSPRIDKDLVERVRKAKAGGHADTFHMTNSLGRRVQVRVERRSDADLYKRMMAAKGLPVQVGES